MGSSLIQRYSIAFILHQKPSFPISYLCLLLLPLATAWFIRNIFFRLFLPHCHFSYFIKKYAGRQRFYLSCGKLFLHRIPFQPKNSLPVLSFRISGWRYLKIPTFHTRKNTRSIPLLLKPVYSSWCNLSTWITHGVSHWMTLQNRQRSVRVPLWICFGNIYI